MTELQATQHLLFNGFVLTSGHNDNDLRLSIQGQAKGKGKRASSGLPRARRTPRGTKYPRTSVLEMR